MTLADDPLLGAARDYLSLAIIQLTEAQYARGVAGGNIRNGRATARSYDNAALLVGNDDSGSNHVVGALGEIAFATWDGDPDFVPLVDSFRRDGDVHGYEVRCRRSPSEELFIRPKDHDDDVYVLVRQLSRLSYHVAGWMHAHEAKMGYWLRDPGKRGPAYFVPPIYLHAMSSIAPARVRPHWIGGKMPKCPTCAK